MADQDRLYSTDTRARAGVAYDEGLRSYMLGVYNYMAMGVAATALIAFGFLNLLNANPDLFMAYAGTPLRFIPFVGLLVLGFVAPGLMMSRSIGVAHGVYWLYVALWGALIGPMVAVFMGTGMAMEVAKAFFIAASVFAAMSLYGYTTKRDLAPMGQFLFMASIGLLIAIVVNVFLQSALMSFITSGLVVLVFSGVTAFETQMIRNMYVEGAGEMNKRASIFGAYALYGTFVTLFIHILNLLGLARE